LSSVIRAATIQEVALELRRGAAGLTMTERTRDGVYDPILLKRMQRAVDAIVAAGLEHLDFGMLCEDAPTEPAIDFGDYEMVYGTAPVVGALLFSPRPPRSVATVFLEG
jgi:hypothetical protein